ncbi:uncharacterized protein LOC131157611 [Malania oleifera]|uniref:uncharacterized protein LOC131157611 n=1 Tax=Malania oleifera TaxID=397392 RepID=UPI0025ADEC63|nr:uncharacterized protein LOC131157611 [Malania oleifera]
MAAMATQTSTIEEHDTHGQITDAHLKFPSFPYTPYAIQIDFMNALYQSLNRGGISMLESPTGTGKTLSIICSALQWLVDQKQQGKSEARDNSEQGRTAAGSDDEPDWLRNFVVEKGNQGQDKGGKKVKKTKSGFAYAKRDKKRDPAKFRDFFSCSEDDGDFDGLRGRDRSKKKSDVVEMNDDDEFLLEDYESEEEGGASGGVRSKRKGGVVCDSLFSDDEDEGDKFDEEEEEGRLKVYFCSRTHSQLSQFVKELRKTNFATELTMVCLGSRKNFCINEEVLKLGSSTRINERCLELQKNEKNEVSKIKSVGAGGRIRRTNASSGCPMLRKHKQQKEFRSEINQQGVLDIEDLVRLGRRMGACPYYGSRSMVSAADLIILPYQSLLSKSSRESLGLNLKNSIIIIDEAHNLADSLISIYDAKITLSQLEQVHSHIEGYFGRFRNLLGPGNRRYIQTLIVLTQAFLHFLHNNEHGGNVDSCRDTEKVTGAEGAFDSSMAINDFLFSLNIDNINLLKLLKYIKESNITHKVSGYGDKMTSFQRSLTVDGCGESNEEESVLSSFRALIDMLISLTNNDGDGRIMISRARRTSSGQHVGYLKYVMLSGEKMFSEIADQAHAIILAGGTLQPVDETRERLFPWLPLDQLYLFSCNHIVPSESILPLAVSHGPSGLSFDFSYSSRASSNMIEELGLLICNLVTVVPEGIVVFFSSFDYEGQVYNAWKASGVLGRIMKRKRVFREPRRSTDVEIVLKDYKETIDSLAGVDPKDLAHFNGAILLAVVGGKISEGINFSDGMGRCIVMVGLPYPSPSDLELMERVKYIEWQGDTTKRQPPAGNECGNKDVQGGFDILRSCKRRGKEYYENLCMKAVNQSIGRAIRHVNDYAAVLLVDSRYASDPLKRSFSQPTSKLPQWIKSRLSIADNYGKVHRMLHRFFKFNRNGGCP